MLQIYIIYIDVAVTRSTRLLLAGLTPSCWSRQLGSWTPPPSGCYERTLLSCSPGRLWYNGRGPREQRAPPAVSSGRTLWKVPAPKRIESDSSCRRGKLAVETSVAAIPPNKTELYTTLRASGVGDSAITEDQHHPQKTGQHTHSKKFVWIMSTIYVTDCRLLPLTWF